MATFSNWLQRSLIWQVWERMLEIEFVDRSIALAGKAFASFFPLVIVVAALLPAGVRNAILSTMTAWLGIRGEALAIAQRRIRISGGCPTGHQPARTRSHDPVCDLVHDGSAAGLPHGPGDGRPVLQSADTGAERCACSPSCRAWRYSGPYTGPSTLVSRHGCSQSGRWPSCRGCGGSLPGFFSSARSGPGLSWRPGWFRSCVSPLRRNGDHLDARCRNGQRSSVRLLRNRPLTCDLVLRCGDVRLGRCLRRDRWWPRTPAGSAALSAVGMGRCWCPRRDRPFRDLTATSAFATPFEAVSTRELCSSDSPDVRDDGRSSNQSNCPR